MDHLTFDEIVEFVSLSELNEDAVKLSAVVNGHIRNCEKCLNLVRSFQMIYDEFTMTDEKNNFNEYAQNIVSENENIQI